MTVSPPSWSQPIARVMEPPPGPWPADPGHVDREHRHGAFQGRRGTASGGADELSGADHDRREGSASPLAGLCFYGVEVLTRAAQRARVAAQSVLVLAPVQRARPALLERARR